MFRIYHSNKLDVLKEILAHLLKHQPQEDVFAQEKILVQSPGMAQWLKIELAKSLKICANMEFPLPASFIWQTFVDVLDDVPKRSAFNKDAMAWHIITRLPTFLTQDEFSDLAQYLADDEPLKLYQLAYKIADIYDQYLVYRPHWIETWQSGSTEYSEQQPWQAILWHDIAQTIIASGQSHYHRANLYQHLIDALSNLAPDKKAKLPQRIFIFGVSALPPKYLESLRAISAHCEIHFFLNNPCQVYWGDIVDAKWLQKQRTKQRIALAQAVNMQAPANITSVEQPLSNAQEAMFDTQGELIVGNPLLASMGKLGRDNLALMLDLDAQEIEAFCDSGSAEHQQGSLLGQITDDILNLHDPSFIGQSSEQLDEGYRRQAIADTDQSIVIHSCHSPMREVEVLHDQLLNMLAQDPSLTPKDIVVMMPDVNAYSPYIQAVFSGTKHRIDFSISDRSAVQEAPILLSFMQLIDLPNQRQTSNELFALLEVPAIMQRFSLNPEALKVIKRWIEQAGIRQGVGQSDSPNNSWQFGLNRMLKGYSQSEGSHDEPLWQDILAYEESSGLVAEYLGQLARFVELITHYKMALNGEKTFGQWQQLISELLHDFYDDAIEYEQELLIISQCMDSLLEQLQLANFEQNIDISVLVAHLESNLAQGQSSARFLAGKLNFCTLMPMRSIPFKVVCVLGMNDGIYPRTIAPLGFDLMANQSQKGDRCRRDDDRYLFLEALLSAQQRFYISYCGRNIKDNSERCPSVLVNELTDYISQGYRLNSDVESTLEVCSKNILEHLTTQHPLTPFNRQYFEPQHPRLFSYQSDWLPAVDVDYDDSAFVAAPLSVDVEQTIIELDQLKRFVKAPCQTFLNQRLGVYFGQQESELSDSEPFDPDALQNYAVKSTLLASYLEQQEQRTLIKLRGEGILPHGHFADLYLDQQSQLMTPLASALKSHMASSLDDIHVNLAITPDKNLLNETTSSQLPTDFSMVLQGWLKQYMTPGVLVRYKSGKANAKFFVDCFIDHLAYCAGSDNETPVSMLMFCQDGQWQFQTMPRDQARNHLARLTSLYIMGQSMPLAFFIQSGWDYLAALFDHKTLMLSQDEKAQIKAEKALLLSIHGNDRRMGEGENLYNNRCFSDVLSTDKAQLLELSELFLMPVLVHLEELTDE